MGTEVLNQSDIDALLSAAWLERTYGSEASILAAHACFAAVQGGPRGRA